mgnify:FL=1
MMHPLLFYTLSALTVAGALGVLLASHPVYAVLSLVLALFGLSALFVALGAYFLAVIQILVYAGAILVLFLFVVRLMDMEPEKLSLAMRRTLPLSGTAFGLLFLWQAVRISVQMIPATPFQPSVTAGTTSAVGNLLFTTYALPFEVASILLLVGIIGAVVLAKKRL